MSALGERLQKRAEGLRYLLQAADKPVTKLGDLTYVSLEEFVAANGRDYAPPKVARPRGLRKGRDGHCFRNATTVAMQRGWRYIEGFAIHEHDVIAHHAWVLDADDNVVETTWRKPGLSYYGLAIPDDLLGLAMRYQESYGFLYVHPDLWSEPYTEDGARLVLERLLDEQETLLRKVRLRI